MKSLESDKKLTVGSIIEKERGYPKGTWHEHFDNGITRKEQIINALQGCINNSLLEASRY